LIEKGDFAQLDVGLVVELVVEVELVFEVVIVIAIWL